MHLRALTTLAIAILTNSCTHHRQWRTDFSPAPLGVEISNRAAQDVANRVLEVYNDNILLSHVEFSDQGGFWTDARPDGGENQLEALTRYVEKDLRTNPVRYRNGAYIVTFTHGWHNNAQEGNQNLSLFREVLGKIRQSDNLKRPLIGVFLSWRGKSRPDKLTDMLTTFWHRKEVAERIGYRGMAETMWRLSLLRREIAAVEGRDESSMHSRLVAVGHSFGAHALASSVTRFFEDELVEISVNRKKPYVGRRWDLVVLVNPASEAIRYDIIAKYEHLLHEKSYRGNEFYAHLPRMLVVGAANDGATGQFFPLGQALDGRTYAVQPGEGDKVRKTLGNYEAFQTHSLRAEGRSAILEPLPGKEGTVNGSKALVGTPMDVFRQWRVTTDPASIRAFMVARADKAVINGHGGIWNDAFKDFVVKLIAAREIAVQRFRH